MQLTFFLDNSLLFTSRDETDSLSGRLDELLMGIVDKYGSFDAIATNGSFFAEKLSLKTTSTSTLREDDDDISDEAMEAEYDSDCLGMGSSGMLQDSSHLYVTHSAHCFPLKHFQHRPRRLGRLLGCLAGAGRRISIQTK